MPPKPIRISAHAGFEMRRRRIKRAEVIGTIRQPGQVVPAIKGRQIYQAKIGPAGRLLLHVVVKQDAHGFQVVTAYKTSKVGKYWRVP